MSEPRPRVIRVSSGEFNDAEYERELARQPKMELPPIETEVIATQPKAPVPAPVRQQQQQQPPQPKQQQHPPQKRRTPPPPTTPRTARGTLALLSRLGNSPRPQQHNQCSERAQRDHQHSRTERCDPRVDRTRWFGVSAIAAIAYRGRRVRATHQVHGKRVVLLLLRSHATVVWRGAVRARSRVAR